MPTDAQTLKLNLPNIFVIDLFPTSIFLPVIYSYLTWILVDVGLAVLVGRDFFKHHRFGTTISLILSFLYTVEPSLLIAGEYFGV